MYRQSSLLTYDKKTSPSETQIGLSKPLTPHSNLMIQEYLTRTERTLNFA